MKILAYIVVIVVIMNLPFPKSDKLETQNDEASFQREKIKVLKKHGQPTDHIKIIKKPKVPSPTPKPPKPKALTIQEISKSKWTHSTTISPIDDSTTVSASLRADEPTYLYNRPVYPYMVIRCKNKKIEAYITWQRFISLQTTQITTRINKERAITQTWQTSRDGKATFAPSGYSFVKKLLGKNGEFIVQVSPHISSDLTTVFDINGFEDSVQFIMDECGR